MRSEILETSDGKCWPQVGCVLPESGSFATGFVVASDLVLTACHAVEGTDSVAFALTGQERFDASVVARYPEHDIAILKVDATGATLPCPLPLTRIPKYPIPFSSWGFRTVERSEAPFALNGWGDIRGRVRNTLLQLHTRTQRPGMSGAPVAIAQPGGPAVVGVSFGRFIPDSPFDDEGLAFAHPIDALPENDLISLGIGMRDPVVPVRNAAHIARLNAEAEEYDRRRGQGRQVALLALVLFLALTLLAAAFDWDVALTIIAMALPSLAIAFATMQVMRWKTESALRRALSHRLAEAEFAE